MWSVPFVLAGVRFGSCGGAGLSKRRAHRTFRENQFRCCHKSFFTLRRDRDVMKISAAMGVEVGGVFFSCA